jgi:hypothetical protein
MGELSYSGMKAQQPDPWKLREIDEESHGPIVNNNQAILERELPDPFFFAPLRTNHHIDEPKRWTRCAQIVRNRVFL